MWCEQVERRSRQSLAMALARWLVGWLVAPATARQGSSLAGHASSMPLGVTFLSRRKADTKQQHVPDKVCNLPDAQIPPGVQGIA